MKVVIQIGAMRGVERDVKEKTVNGFAQAIRLLKDCLKKTVIPKEGNFLLVACFFCLFAGMFDHTVDF